MRYDSLRIQSSSEIQNIRHIAFISYVVKYFVAGRLNNESIYLFVFISYTSLAVFICKSSRSIAPRAALPLEM